mmetsp:Transcript_8376/g.52342  ORF Transcript_8376/g.52342 Transcript_8376/m.52342 type:complete len:90 (+) Transcript_8376:1253-1522(+)
MLFTLQFCWCIVIVEMTMLAVKSMERIGNDIVLWSPTALSHGCIRMIAPRIYSSLNSWLQHFTPGPEHLHPNWGCPAPCSVVCDRSPLV